MVNADTRAIERIAAERDGVISRRQLVALGATPDWISRQVTGRRWQRVHPGVYVLHTGRLSWRTRARAALVYAGPGAALSHESAAFHRQLRDDPGRLIVVSVPAHRRVRRQPGIDIRRRTPMPATGGRLRATYEIPTVLDLADRPGSTEDDVVGLVCALAARDVPLDALTVAVRARRRVRHRRPLLELAVLVDLGIESPLEFRYHGIERRHGLPDSVLQQREVLFGLWLRSDCRYHRMGVRVELDGQLAHPGGRTDADTFRDNQVLIATGEITLRFRWRHVVATPCDVAAQVALALRSRGWNGTPTPCSPSCALHRLAKAA